MDSSSWIHGYAANSNGGGGSSGFMCGYAASPIPAALQCSREQEHEQREVVVSSEIQQHLNKISMEMNMDDEPAAAYSQHCSVVVDDFDFLTNSYDATGGCSLPSSFSTSSSFRVSLSCSPEISSTAALVLAAPATGLQFPEVSSLVALEPEEVLPYDDQHVANFHGATMAPGGMSTSASAFRRYEQHLGLGPRRRLAKPGCGQRMLKTAMSVLAKMHTAMRYQQQQQEQQQQFYYQQQQASAAELSGNQLQHMISERKRREKLNDSFRALKTVLPPGSKKLDKTSILIVAREYVNSLKTKLCELEEKNQALQSLLARPTSSAEESAGEKVEIQISIAAAAEDDQTGEVCTVNVSTPVGGNTTDLVLRILQCLKEQIGEDVSLVSMKTGDGPHRASLTLDLKSVSGAKWKEEAVREAVTKGMTSPAPVVLRHEGYTTRTISSSSGDRR